MTKPKEIAVFALLINDEQRVLYKQSEKNLLLKKVKDMLDSKSDENSHVTGFHVSLTSVPKEYYDSLADYK